MRGLEPKLGPLSISEFTCEVYFEIYHLCLTGIVFTFLLYISILFIYHSVEGDIVNISKYICRAIEWCVEVTNPQKPAWEVDSHIILTKKKKIATRF